MFTLIVCLYLTYSDHTYYSAEAAGYLITISLIADTVLCLNLLDLFR